MKKPFYGLVAAVSAVAMTALGASVASAESKVGQSILSADIPAQAMSATEMEDIEGQGWRWRWRVRISGAPEESGNSDDGPNPTIIEDEPLGDGTYSVKAFNTSTVSSVSVSTTCSGTCTSSSSAVATSWNW